MDEATPHLHIDFVPYTTGSKRGLDTRVFLKQALMALGFKGGTRQETELNQWVMAENQQLVAIMLEHGIEWEQKGTHEKHLSLLDFEKKERAKEVAELEAKKAKPLIKKMVQVMRSIYSAYLDISNKFVKLQAAYNRERNGNERLTNRLEEVLEENRELRTVAADFGRIKAVFGSEQINAVINRAKQQERIEAERKRAARRKHNREAR